MPRSIQFCREVWGLDRLLFSVQPPSAPYRSVVFSQREKEFERAELHVMNGHNLLVSGLFGIGKTIFLQELISDLQKHYTSEEVIAVYECLDSVDADFLTTILRILARALREEDEEARRIDWLLAGAERTEQSQRKEASGVKSNIPVVNVDRTGEQTTAETEKWSAIPHPGPQIRELIQRALELYPERRIIIAIDDLDKRDPQTVRDLLRQARSTLHSSCAFIMTGHPLGVLRNIYSTAGAVFDELLELEMLPPEGMRDLMFRYLEAGRRKDAPQKDLEPFTEEAAQVIIARAFGIPRLLNKICSHILTEAALLRRPVVDRDVLRECWENASIKLKRQMGEEIARIFEVLHEQTDGFDPSRVPDEVYTLLGVDSHQALLAKFTVAVNEDVAVGVEVRGKTHYYANPLLEAPPTSPNDGNS